MTTAPPDLNSVFKVLKAMLAVAMIPLQLIELMHAIYLDIRDNIAGRYEGVSDRLWAAYDATANQLMDAAESLHLVRSQGHSVV